jgi:hypothetical protein
MTTDFKGTFHAAFSAVGPQQPLWRTSRHSCLMAVYWRPACFVEVDCSVFATLSSFFFEGSVSFVSGPSEPQRTLESVVDGYRR